MSTFPRNMVYKDVVTTFITAFSLIVYEVVLSRFFAAIMEYNYVYIVVTVATLGIGLGGAFSYSRFSWPCLFKIYISGWYALSISGIVILIYISSFMVIYCYLFLALIPFFLGGWLLSDIMQRNTERIGFLYFSDLVGAGLGAVAAVGLMNSIGPMQSISLLSLLVFSCFFLLDIRKRARRTIIPWSIVYILLAVHYVIPVYDYVPYRAYETSPHQIFAHDREAEVVYTKWNAFSKTDVYDANDGDLLYITIDGGAVSPISKYNGDLSQVDYLRNTTSSLAFQNGSKNRALIIGAGGGQEILLALMTGFKEIEAVDINEESFRAVSNVSAFSGDIYDSPRVKSIVADGRNYIRESKSKYDIIYLSLVKKSSESSFGLSLMENYIFTQEAISEYMNKLNDKGKLGFLVHDEIELYKMIHSAQNSLVERGVPEAEVSKYFAIVETYQHLGHVVTGLNGSKITRPLLLLSKEPFEAAEAATLLADTKRIQQVPVHIPHVYERYTKVQQLMNSQKVDLSKNRDDMPFFYNKAASISPMLLVLLGSVIAISILLAKMTRITAGSYVYFSLIAIGFMMVEVTLIQRLVLPLGHPTLSFVFVLGVVLVSSGVGSLYSARWFAKHSSRYFPLLLTGILIVVVHVLISWYSRTAIAWDSSLRMVATAIAIIPLGVLMGMPFPYGLSQIRDGNVAAAWGLNGILSVVGSLLAITSSFTWGFQTTMLIGAAMYIFLYFIQPSLRL